MKNDDQEYHSDPAISKTKLGHFAKSPNDFWRYHIGKTEAPPEPKRQMIVGSAVHKIVLEGSTVDDCVAVYPKTCFKSNGHKNPVPCRKFEEENADRFCVTEYDGYAIDAVCRRISRHELGGVLNTENIQFEQAVFWEDKESGLPCRLKCDFYFDMGDHILAYDLKTTEDIYPVGVRRTSKTFKYWLQDAHYSNGFATRFGKPVKFAFWFVEVKSPFRIARYEYPEQSRETARTARASLMSRLSECFKTDNWHDPWTRETNYLELAPWDVDTVATEQELEGFEDDEA